MTEIGPSRTARFRADGREGFHLLRAWQPAHAARALAEFRTDAANGIRNSVELSDGSHYWHGTRGSTNHIGFFFVVRPQTVLITAAVDARQVRRLPLRP